MQALLAGFARVYAASRWLRLRFTPAGRAVLGVCIVAAVLGVDTERSMAFQVFALSAALLLIAALAARAMPRASVVMQRELPPYATAGERFSYRLRVRNHGRAPLAPALVLDELAQPFPSAERLRRAKADATGAGNWLDRRIGFPHWLATVRQLRGGDIEAAALPALASGGAADLAIALTPLRRGLLRFSATRILRPDLLGLVNRIGHQATPAELTVLPARYPVPPLALPGARRLQRGGLTLASAVGESEEFVQLRDYRPGDAMRHIHWRSFARLGKPVVKEHEDEYFTRYALALDTFGREASERAFEAAVSVAASLVASLEGQDALLDLMFVEDHTYVFTAGRGLGDVAGLLRVLAAVEPTEHADFALLAQHVLSHAAQLSGCILILLELDAARRRFVERLRGLARLLVLLVNEERPDPEAGITWIDPGDVPGSLRWLKVAW